MSLFTQAGNHRHGLPAFLLVFRPAQAAAALHFPRVPSFGAFGRRPRCPPSHRERPSSETLHKPGLPPWGAHVRFCQIRTHAPQQKAAMFGQCGCLHSQLANKMRTHNSALTPW
jgi:hypothetical protein